MKNLKLLSTTLLIALLCSVIIAPAQAAAQPEPEATAVYMLDIASGTVIFSKNADEALAPASLTKIMTVLLAVEAIEQGVASLNDLVTVSENISTGMDDDASSAGLEAGETLTLEDLLYCALVSSAGDACNAIAEYIGGSIPVFLTSMNQRAQALGCTNTNFMNTHGMPAENHYSSARDVALITKAAVSYPLFATISKTVTYDIAATNQSDERHLSNTNNLLHKDNKYYYEYASGVKTGHTEAAGYCLASTARKNAIDLLCVVMGAKATGPEDAQDLGSFSETIALYNWAFENFSYRDILKMTELVDELPVVMGQDSETVSVHPEEAISALLPNDEDLSSFIRDITIYSEVDGTELVAPVSAGTVLGEITISRDGTVYGTTKLVASTSIDLSYTRYMTERIDETLKKPSVTLFIVIIAFLLAVYIFLLVRYYYLKIAARSAAKSDKTPKEPKAPKEPKPPKSEKWPGFLASFRREAVIEPDEQGVLSVPPRRANEPEVTRFIKVPEAPSEPEPFFEPETYFEPKPDTIAEQSLERDYFEEFFKKPEDKGL
ncbi:MAG: D-alanyl-D-alanine carboxypeptidase [Oscillospiraceae bacterium]|jgi:D-alanyl-D-alanine carboxypeptidase (penicillin-binding protein 5/6)|nr:D-alanyl-D-alanine carboxypeptidase [Oscillospiraceae bacterium]